MDKDPPAQQDPEDMWVAVVVLIVAIIVTFLFKDFYLAK